MIFPLVLGPGKRLFGQGTTPGGLKLIASNGIDDRRDHEQLSARRPHQDRDHSMLEASFRCRNRAPGAHEARGQRTGFLVVNRDVCLTVSQ